MADQKTDNDQGKSPNMTINTTSTSPKTTGEGTAWRGSEPISDNNGHLGFGVKERRNKG